MGKPFDYEVLTIKEVAELIRIHPSTVYRLLKRGELEAWKVGSDWRFSTRAVRHWIDSRPMETPTARTLKPPLRQSR